MPERPPADRATGRRLVEPPGYVIASFLSAAGLVGGIGLAPDGLLLFAAAFILSVIEWRRFRAANPWLRLETPDDYKSPEGKLFLRYSAMGTGINVALAIAAVVLVQTENRDAAAIGPALIGGVATIAINYLLKLGVARLGSQPPTGGPDEDDDDDHDDHADTGRGGLSKGDPDDPDDPDDGFVEQDDRALNGPRIEPPHRSKSRRGRAPKDDRRY